ncbi:MAG TPA: VanW family protein [Acidimicrobiales bacterium]|nr:VanW family protein [Acidimicrobiales bacterium]
MIAVIGALAVVSVLAWAIDSHGRDGVQRNVTLAGQGIGGLSRDQLTAVVGEMASRYVTAQVRVEAPGGGFDTDSHSLGLAVQEQATVEAALEVGRSGSVVSRLRGWVASLVRPRQAPVRIGVDRGFVYRVVATRDPGPRVPALEPTLNVVRGKLVAVEGKPGRGIDAREVIKKLPQAATRGLPLIVSVERPKVPPRFSLGDADRVATEAEALSAQGLAVRAGSQEARVPAVQLRSWLVTEPTDAALELAVDAKAAVPALAKLLPKPVTPSKDAGFVVEDGRVRIVASQPGTGCCSEAAGEAVEQALRARSQEPVSLPLKSIQLKRTTEEAAGLAVKEPVATFTTGHKPNQPRVANIHRMADLVRGQIIEPGKTFSVNEFVRERTTDKGFVVDAVIEDGKFEESVGGGVSQFATTAFNAAFFAGLEFAEYQSHSIYIARYPYGREATLSYPHPDLKITNPSPYGVLIWPTYTDTSITVTLYSTKWADSAQTGQTAEPRQACTRVRTERTRRFVADGTTKVDHVSALYRPGEGVDCP